MRFIKIDVCSNTFNLETNNSKSIANETKTMMR